MSYNNTTLVKQVTTTLSNAPSSVLTLNELRFRYASTTSTFDIEVQSSSSTPIPFKAYSQEYFASLSFGRNCVFLSGVAPAVNTTWLTVPGGGLDANEYLFHDIFTENNVYRLDVLLFDTSALHLVGKSSY